MTKVLVVLTNQQSFDTINRAAGIWLSEATHFVDVMAANHIDVDYVSPSGGYVPIDPGSLMPDALDAVNNRFYNDADFRKRALAASLSPAQVTALDYQAIYFAGGHGTMWDFPHNQALGAIAKQIYDNGGYLTAVCHGVVGLLPVKDDGQALIAGKHITGFSNEEEAINHLTDAVPFLAEDALKAAGAQYSSAAPYTKNVVVDGQLITGQNPQSARGVGEALIQALA